MNTQRGNMFASESLGDWIRLKSVFCVGISRTCIVRGKGRSKSGMNSSMQWSLETSQFCWCRRCGPQ